VTQGDLIISEHGKPLCKFAMNKAMVMDDEKSYEGIVVKKLAGKAAMASESAHSC